MSSQQSIHETISEEEYLSGELISELKHEYVNGYIYAMAGASEAHNLISTNISREAGNQLKSKKSPCKNYISDMKVKTLNGFYYPDVMICCEQNDNEEYFKQHPVILFEVLSESTQKNDKTTKMLDYFNLPSLMEYVLVDQYSCEVQVFRREEHWKSSYYFLGDEIHFKTLNIIITVEDIYYQIENKDMKAFIALKEDGDHGKTA